MEGRDVTDKELRRKLRSAIRRLVRAEVADAWKGGGCPEDIPYIERELKSADKALQKLIDEQVFAKQEAA